MMCGSCGQAYPVRYKISQIDVGGGVVNTVDLCSLICAVKWAYNAMAMQSAALAINAKGAFDQLVGLLKGK